MDYTDLLAYGAGILTIYLKENIQSLLRVRSLSEIPITAINIPRAITLNSFLSEWGALLPISLDENSCNNFKERLPEEVRQAFSMHIHKREEEAWASSMNGEDCLRSWRTMFQNNARLKSRIKAFYQEPAVREYLRA